MKRTDRGRFSNVCSDSFLIPKLIKESLLAAPGRIKAQSDSYLANREEEKKRNPND